MKKGTTIKSRSIKSKSISDVWHESPETIQRFLDQQPDYEQLCTEVAYILKKRLSAQSIEFADVTWRAKTLKSFIEKIQRKKYEEVFSQVTDFAGVRVVCLYINDIKEIEKIIEHEFETIERVDKLNDQGVDRFGYGAIHFIVRLGKGSSGARYDNLKDLICEIQVRTVAQDAWAIIEHHLVYKQESDIPKHLIRKLNRLAAFFEDADDQFERVRQERREYLESVRSQREKPQEFLDNEINLDSFREYLAWKFKGKPLEAFEGQTNQLFNILDKSKYKKLSDIDKVVSLSEQIWLKINKELLEENPSATDHMALYLCIADDSIRAAKEVPKGWQDAIQKELN